MSAVFDLINQPHFRVSTIQIYDALRRLISKFLCVTQVLISLYKSVFFQFYLDI